ncbi:ATP-binding protein [Streptomyces sp. NPDC018584]|uniref:ATP-binding protein n=1 Tax=unclassified Streptomyces TaxID=2593676 RepID=UPI0037B7DF56
MELPAPDEPAPDEPAPDEPAPDEPAPDEPALVRADTARLHQVVVNLLANARTHTPPPGTMVTARVRKDGLDVRPEIQDDGPGIPPALLSSPPRRFDGPRPGPRTRHRHRTRRHGDRRERAGADGPRRRVVRRVGGAPHGTGGERALTGGPQPQHAARTDHLASVGRMRTHSLPGVLRRGTTFLPHGTTCPSWTSSPARTARRGHRKGSRAGTGSREAPHKGWAESPAAPSRPVTASA